MSGRDVRGLYDGLAVEYDLIHRDWDASVARQGEALDRLIAERLGPGPHRVLDCTCGIGTQALGLAAAGHRVHATDLSPEAVARAEREAATRGLAMTFGVADVASLATEVPGQFDVVLSCDNALAHMLTQGQLVSAAKGMASKLRSGGLLVASVRDYDALVAEKPTLPSLSEVDEPSGRRIVFQHWDWRDDGQTYAATIFIIRRAGGDWAMTHYETVLRAVLRADLDDAVAAAGLGELRWHEPAEGTFYQPVLTALAPPPPSADEG